jgi:arabinose-5-phosphate isomerase
MCVLQRIKFDCSLDAGVLVGTISDGDLRRLLERDGSHALERAASEIMNPHPRTIDGSAFAAAALALMEERMITSLIVTGVDGLALGVIHLHDLWTLELI